MSNITDDIELYKDQFIYEINSYLEDADIDFTIESGTPRAFGVRINFDNTTHVFSFPTNDVYTCQDEIIKDILDFIDDLGVQDEDGEMFDSFSQPLIKISYVLDDYHFFKNKPEVEDPDKPVEVLIFEDVNGNAQDVVLNLQGPKYVGFLTGKGYNVPRSIQFEEHILETVMVNKLNSLGDFDFRLKKAL